MALLLKSGAVFIHVPKTGGGWVHTALHEQGLLHRDARVAFNHSPPGHVNEVMRWTPGRYLRHWPMRPLVTPGALRRAPKFCFVRDPLKWYESWWKFMAGRWKAWEPGRWHPQREIDGCGDDDFGGFVEKVLEAQPGYVSRMYAMYTDGCAFVGRFERLADDLSAALEELGVAHDAAALKATPHVNVSRSLLGRPEWDPALRRRVEEAEREAIERFGYGGGRGVRGELRGL